MGYRFQSDQSKEMNFIIGLVIVIAFIISSLILINIIVNKTTRE
jgi:hypothetical protein